MRHVHIFVLCNLLIFFYLNAVEGIVYGKDASPGSFKFMVSVRADDQHICGGTIIGFKYVVTAAYCVIDRTNQIKNQKFSIRGGVIDLNAPDTSGIVRNVIKMFIPSEYVRSNPTNEDTNQISEFFDEQGDLAVLKLDRALPLDGNVISVVNFPPRKYGKIFMRYYNVVAKLVGFGSDVVDRDVKRDRSNNVIERIASSSMKFAETKVLHKHTFKSMFLIPLSPSHVGAQIMHTDNGRFGGACNGDTGGPLIMDEDTLIGVLSQNRQNCNEMFGASIYTRVTSYIPFMNKAMYEKPMDNARIVEYQLLESTNGTPEVWRWVEI